MMAHPDLTPREQIDREARRRELEHAFAIDGAGNAIRIFCQPVVAGPNGIWYDTADVAQDDSNIYIGKAVEYLDLCGLLERDPEAPHIVRILEVTK